MTTRTTITNKDNPDAELLAMIQRHETLWSEWECLAQEHEDDPRISPISEECAELEPRIIATPAHTEAGLAGKKHVIRVTGYAGRAGSPGAGDVDELVDVILKLDAARIAAAG